MAGRSRKRAVCASRSTSARRSCSSSALPEVRERTNASRSPGGCSSTFSRSLSSVSQRARSIGCRSRQFAEKPDLGGGPVAPDRDWGDIEHGGGLLDAESAEKFQLDDFCFSRCELFKCLQCVVKRNEIRRGLFAHGERVVEGKVVNPAAPFQILAARVIDKDAT